MAAILDILQCSKNFTTQTLKVQFKIFHLSPSRPQFDLTNFEKWRSLAQKECLVGFSCFGLYFKKLIANQKIIIPNVFKQLPQKTFRDFLVWKCNEKVSSSHSNECEHQYFPILLESHMNLLYLLLLQLSFSPRTPFWSHFKLMALLATIFAFSGFMLLVSVFVGFFGGINTFAFMCAEVRYSIFSLNSFFRTLFGVSLILFYDIWILLWCLIGKFTINHNGINILQKYWNGIISCSFSFTIYRWLFPWPSRLFQGQMPFSMIFYIFYFGSEKCGRFYIHYLEWPPPI